MNGLEHIIKSETENLQDLTEDAVRHTEELWSKVTETYNQMQDRGQEFLQTSSTVRRLGEWWVGENIFRNEIGKRKKKTLENVILVTL